METLESKISELQKAAEETGQISKGLEEKDEKISDLEGKLAETEKMTEELSQRDATITELNSKLEEADNKINELEKEVEKLTPPPEEIPVAREAGGVKTVTTTVPGEISGIYACPRCGAKRIKDETDRTKILYMAAGAPVYAKKHKCLNCGNEWK